MYSQNSEEKIILDYFSTPAHRLGKQAGTLLDIGANDGKTLSNSLALIECGWKAVLVEPDVDAFEKLTLLHEGNQNVICYNIALAEKDGEADFYKSGAHLHNGDTGLLSTLSARDYDKWKTSTEFEIVKTKTICFRTFVETCPEKKFDFITIDAEGMDWNIVSQVDLNALDCDLVCIEHNGQRVKTFNEYFNSFGMTLIHGNGENLIYGK